MRWDTQVSDSQCGLVAKGCDPPHAGPELASDGLDAAFDVGRTPARDAFESLPGLTLDR